MDGVRAARRGAHAPGGDFEHATDWAGKAPGAAARLALVLHGIEHAHGVPWQRPIGLDTMRRALAIMAVSMRHTLAVYDLMDADPEIAKGHVVWNRIERHRPAVVFESELFHALKGTIKKMRDLEPALVVLEERGYIVRTKAPTGRPGRPASPTVRVRPGMWEGRS